MYKAVVLSSSIELSEGLNAFMQILLNRLIVFMHLFARPRNDGATNVYIYMYLWSVV